MYQIALLVNNSIRGLVNIGGWVGVFLTQKKFGGSSVICSRRILPRPSEVELACASSYQWRDGRDVYQSCKRHHVIWPISLVSFLDKYMEYKLVYILNISRKSLD